MNPLKQQDLNDKQFAYRLAMMIETGLINYKYYMPWTDEIIDTTKNPPYWILELTTVRYSLKAVEVVREFAGSEPFEAFDIDNYADRYLACLFLRYNRGEHSWATFLRLAGAATDGSIYDGLRQCEDFYNDLNDLEAGEFSKDIEEQQRAEFEADYREAIATVEPSYAGFLAYFRRSQRNK